MPHNEHHHTKDVEFEILSEIKKSEAKSLQMIESAMKENYSIISEAHKNASKLIQEKQEKMRKEQESRLSDFREKTKLIREEKLGEAKIQVRQIKAKSEKNLQKAADFVMQKLDSII